jgi:MOSC domain-containing protein YiiM
MRNGRIVQISISAGGVPKLAVPNARVGVLGLDGDRHRDAENHGGPERAVCLFSMEQIEALRREGHPVAPGTLGENVTVEGLSWPDVVPGARLALGDTLVLEVSRYTSPCVNIKPLFIGGDYARVSQKRHPGFSRVYARVVTPGLIRERDPVTLLPASAPAAEPASPASS